LRQAAKDSAGIELAWTLSLAPLKDPQDEFGISFVKFFKAHQSFWAGIRIEFFERW
jgi:hypothetical protein